MKSFYAGLIGLTAASALALSANAADLSGPGGYKDYAPAAGWNGFYLGPSLGYAWDTNSDQLACNPACGGPFGGVSPEGWLWGFEFGYDWQRPGSPLVLGIETDVAAGTVIGQGSDANGNFYESRLEALGTVRGRAGYAMGRTLLYLTGGLAWGTVSNSALSGSFAESASAIGYVLGAGVEYKILHDMSLKLEYQYIDLGKNDPQGYSAAGGTVRDDAYNSLRVGLNYFPFPAYNPISEPVIK